MHSDIDQQPIVAPPIEEVPAAHLAGRVLPNGWEVKGRVQRAKTATGGRFSYSYRVANGAGVEAYMKALDISQALAGERDLVVELQAFSEAAVFERNLLHECNGRRLTRVIQLLDYVEVQVPEAGLLGRVPCLVFELADGDIREYQAKLEAFDLAWVLRTLKHVAVGIEQLHGVHATHQDIKPSNVLTQAAGREMKLGDLGRAERQGIDGPTSTRDIPGAIAYAPPEQLYGAFDYRWETRRSADMYHLGSLALQLFVGHTVTLLIQQELPGPARIGSWSGSFHDVLPYLRVAHGQVLDRLRAVVEERAGHLGITADFVRAVQEMTDPDPSLRGHPQDRRALTSSYAVRRYVSLFNRLAAHAESAMIRGNRVAAAG